MMRSLPSLTFVISCSLLAAACTGGGGSDGEDGTAVLSFGVSATVRSSPALVDPLVGTIYGKLFLAADVSATGPADGAPTFGDITMVGADLQTATTTTSWTSPPLAPDTYVFLGFYDLDGNGAESQRPDSGDPVTLPSAGFAVGAGEQVTITPQFDLVFN
jgi:hypothetical protein